MEIAKIQVSGVIAQAVSLQNIPAGIIGAEVAFAYIDPMWDALTKTVVLKGCCTKDIVDAGDTVIVPAEVVATPGVRVYVGVYGVDAAGTIAIPTLWATLGITRAAADPSGDESTDPVLPVWAQIQAQLGDLEELNTESKETLVAAINEALTKGGGTVDEVTVQKIVGDYLDENPPGQGADGGYYTPAVTQPDVETMEISFARSNEEMPAVEPVQIKLPVPDSSQTANGMSQTLRVAIYNLLMDAAYQSAGHDADKAALAELLTGSSSGGESGGDDSGDCGETVVYYTIEKTLTNVSISNGAATVQAGTAYSATLTADEGYTLYEVTVTMGGEAVTVIDGVISISAVTGNIAITATATAESTGGETTWTSGTAFDLTGKIIENTTIATETGVESTSEGNNCTDYIYCYGVDYLYSAKRYYVIFYDANKGYISSGETNTTIAVPETAVYCRFSERNSQYWPISESITVVPLTVANNYTAGEQSVTWAAGVIDTTTGVVSSSVTTQTTENLIPCGGASTLTLGESQTIAVIAFYDANQNFIYTQGSKATPYSLPVGVSNVRISAFNAAVGAITLA